MNLGSQYYRAPFPDSQYWDDDLRRMRDAGLDTVQLWLSWGWIEASPGQYRYDDYDRLIELAGKHGLGLVLSTVAEVQPNWIHRIVPDSSLVDVNGRPVASCSRNEHHFGLTPGGCTDHPEVWRRMADFIARTGQRYAPLPHLRGWDIWNELRWDVHAEALTCHCPSTMKAFRAWLKDRFGSLEGLNAAWKRRYDSWEDVISRKIIDGVYTELMAFQHFISHRADRHARLRYETMRAVDTVHPITAHGDRPSALYAGNATEYALNRGNDWFLADNLDGVGCSNFPQWFHVDDADFGLKLDMLRSAARGKKVWLSELQGGRSATGFEAHENVRADQQQRWLWNGVGCGAETILFWCWRDEVFGRESGGFGMSGNDGFADERLAAMKFSGDLLARHDALFRDFRPDPAQVGVFVTPQTQYLAWAQEGHSERIAQGLTGYGRALTRCAIPVQYVEECHLDGLDALKVLFLPRLLVTDPDTEEALTRFVERGGTLVAESECGAFDSRGFYRYPADRFLARMGVTEIGRRTLMSAERRLRYGDGEFVMDFEQWLTPVEPGADCVVRPFGAGRVVHLAGYAGNAYRQRWRPGFEDFLTAVIGDAGVCPAAAVLRPTRDGEHFLYLKWGHSGDRSLLFVFFPDNSDAAEIAVGDTLFPDGRARDLFSGTVTELRSGDSGRRRMTLTPGRFRLALYTDA